MTKDFGPVSGYLDPLYHSWEQVTWRTGRPPLDKEFNLFGELFLRQLYRSGDLCSGFLFSRDYFSPEIFPKQNTGNYVVEPGNYRNELPAAAPAANLFYFGPKQVAHVNDMLVYLATKTSEWLPITLNAAPIGVAVKRWDLVFIEVWRGLLTANPAADTANGLRDSNGKIFYNGWADSPTADNFVDDILDGGAGQETSRRVQVQWRVRVVDNVDLNTYPDGIDDTAVVFARGPEAAPTAFTYTNYAASGDPGLWISTGPHSKTVDGNVYAIPLCAVARRNQNTWDKDTNQNGGLGVRPDDLTYDIIEERDIVDLRKTVSIEWDFEAVMKANASWVLDAKQRTYWEDHGLGGGERATWWKQADEVGPVDTPGATKIDEPDGHKFQFSDAPVANESFVIKTLLDRTVWTLPNEWKAGDQFDIALPVSSEGIIDLVNELALYSGYENNLFTVLNLNTQTVTITLTAAWEAAIPALSRQNVDIFARISVSYPGGRGLSRDPREYQHTLSAGTNFTVLEANDDFVYESVPPAGTVDLNSGSNIYRPSRTATVNVDVQNVNLIINSLSTTTTQVPAFIESVQGIYDQTTDPGKTTNLFVSFVDNVITHNPNSGPHAPMIVDYTSKEPVQLGQQFTMYYYTMAAQTLDVNPSGLNVPTAKVHVLYAPDYLYAVSAGSGSHNPGYPYVAPAAQIPIRSATVTGDDQLDLNNPPSVDDFGAAGMFMRLPTNVPLAHIPFFDFTTPGKDAERRSYYAEVTNTVYDDEINGAPVAYQPSVFAKRMQNSHTHKVVYPCIGMCVEDTNLGKRGSLLLLVFTATREGDQNSVVFDLAAGGTSCVGVYRLKGNPIASPRKYQLGLSLV